MSGLVLYDDARARTFEPFALTRPVSALRAGALLVRERWARAHGAAATGVLVASHLDTFEEDGAPPVAAEIPAGTIVANARCLVGIAERLGDTDVWECEGRVAAVRLAHAIAPTDVDEGSRSLDDFVPARATRITIEGRWMEHVWELVTTLLPQLREDIVALGPTLDCVSSSGVVTIGQERVYLERGAVVEPHVVFDVTGGPILVRAGAVVRAFTRLVGPCVVGRNATVLGDRVHGCSIGDGSIIRGEISETVVLGQANKAHDGFVGHSYLGRWVNLGAGTTTSNLKNTYGPVGLWTPAGIRDTTTLKLGTFFGDHVKTGIGMRLTTGTVVGAGSNIYGSVMPPKFVRPFSWGDGASLGSYHLDKFLEVTSRAMARRQISLSAGARQQLTSAFHRALQEWR